MSKSKEELNELKKEIEDLNEKIRELTPEKLKEVTGGAPESAGALTTTYTASQGLLLMIPN